MKKTSILFCSFIIFVFVLSISSLTFASSPGTNNALLSPKTNKKFTNFLKMIAGNITFVTATGEGTVKVVPSGSSINVSVEVFGKTHGAAYNSLLKNAAIVTSHFKGLPYLKSMQTRFITITPHKIYKNMEWIMDGYNGTENLAINISGNENTNMAILFLLKHKYLRINGINPVFTNLKKYKLEAIRLAYNEALLKAKVILNSLKIKSFKVRMVKVENIPSVFPRPGFALLKADSLRTGAPGSQVYFYKKEKITFEVFIKLASND